MLAVPLCGVLQRHVSAQSELDMTTRDEAGTLFESPPAPLPSVETTGLALLRQLQHPGQHREATHWVYEDPSAQSDVRRLWALTMTLVTQRTEIEGLIGIMGPAWFDKNQKPLAERSESDMSKGLTEEASV